MLAILFNVLIAAVVFVSGRTDSQYGLTENQQTLVAFEVRSPQPERFETSSEAAYAAALTYGRKLLSDGEIGAKIYVDMVDSRPQYSFGPLLVGQLDPSSSDEEITYNTTETDGHLAVIGLWHEHPIGTPLDSLYAHYDEIARTKQTIWTTIGKNLYVQYWNGSDTAPQWRPSAAQLPPICSSCTP